MISRNIVSSIYKSISRSILKYANMFSPASISKVLQYTLDSETPYTSSTLNGISVLSSLEDSDSYRFPLKGRAWLFDGTNDYGTLGARITSGSVTNLTVSAWIKTSASIGRIAGEYDDSVSGGTQRAWLLGLNSGKLSIILSGDGFVGSFFKNYETTATVNSNNWQHIAITFSPNNLLVYINGSVAETTKLTDTVVNSIFNSSSFFGIGARRLNTTPEGFYSGSIRDLRVYTTTKSAAEILAIYNQASTPYTIDTTGLLAHYWCNEEAGTTGFDSSGNDNHLTLTNITPATFHAVDQGVVYNPANNVGHTSRMVFNGTNTQVSTNQKFNIAGATLTLTAKIRTNGAGGTYPIFDNGDLSGGYMVFINVSNCLDIIMRQAGSSNTYYRVAGSTLLNDGVEREVVLTLNNTGATPVITATLNGVAETLTVTTAPTGVYGDNASATGVIGVRISSPLYWSGTIADVSVSNGTQSYSATGYNSTLWGTGTVSGTTQSLIVPQDESTPADSVFGSPLNYTGQAPYPATIESPCVRMDGSNDYGVPQTNFPVIASGAMYAIMKPDGGLSLQYLINARDPNRMYLGLNGSNRIYVRLGDGADFNHTVTETDWVKVGVSWSGGNYKVFRNGDIIFTGTYTGAVGGSTSTISSYTGVGSFFKGYVSDIRIYNTAKSDAEMLAIANGNPDTTGLYAWWPMQEGGGLISYDISGNGNHLVWSGITESTFWANRNGGKTQDVAMLYGGRIGSSNQFIPGNTTGSNAADGNPKTLSAGKFSNPYSRLNHDPYDAAEYNSLAIPSYEALPCLTGNGSDNYVDLGSPLIPATGDFELSLWYYHVTNDTTTRSIFSQHVDAQSGRLAIQANTNIAGGGTAGLLRVFIDSGPNFAIASGLTEASWHKITFRRVVNDFTLISEVLGGNTRTATATASVTLYTDTNSKLLILNTVAGQYNNGRVAYLTVTTGGVTKEIPLTAGSGADLTLYTDGVESTLSTAVKGTLTSVWSNTTDARIPSTDNAYRAIKPINTKFRRTDTDGDDRFVILRSPATGEDLTNLIEYTS